MSAFWPSTDVRFGDLEGEGLWEGAGEKRSDDQRRGAPAARPAQLLFLGTLTERSAGVGELGWGWGWRGWCS
jgi:hypothetical protein